MSLFDEWDLLVEGVSRSLDGRRPKGAVAGWCLGSPLDAVAVAAAYQRASGRRSGAGRARVNLTPRPPLGRAITVPFHHVRRVAGGADDEGVFQRCDGRWYPAAELLEMVVIGQPRDPVDLVVVDAGFAEGNGQGVSDAVACLRSGGVAVWDDRSPAEPIPEGLVRAGEDPRILVKAAPGRSSPGRAAGERGGGGEADAGAVKLAPGETGPSLARRQMEARLVESHLALARSLAARFPAHAAGAHDLEQVAFLALVRAAGRYDPGRGAAFATFATVSVLGELKRHMRDKTWSMRMPRSVQETHLVVRAASDELTQRLGCSPTIAQLSEHLGLSEEDILGSMEAASQYAPQSLDAPGPGGDVAPDPAAGGPDPFELVAELTGLRRGLRRLEPTERFVVNRIYFDGWTQRQVAEALGANQMYVSRMVARVLAKLRPLVAVDDQSGDRSGQQPTPEAVPSV